MKELSLHILDIVQNSVHAGATEIGIEVTESLADNQYIISISDNGKGMDEETLQALSNPFFTTKNKKTGLGIPLLQQHAEMTGGSVNIWSEPGKGTVITATFMHNHFDRQPMGDMAATFISLIVAYPQIDFTYNHATESNDVHINTFKIKEVLEEIPITSKEVLEYIRSIIQSIT